MKHATSLVTSALESSLVFQIIYGWDGASDPQTPPSLFQSVASLSSNAAAINRLNFSITLIGSIHSPASHFTTEQARANIPEIYTKSRTDSSHM